MEIYFKVHLEFNILKFEDITISSLINIGNILTTLIILEMGNPRGLLNREENNSILSFTIPSNEET
jgi:hypothetical protein